MWTGTWDWHSYWRTSFNVAVVMAIVVADVVFAAASRLLPLLLARQCLERLGVWEQPQPSALREHRSRSGAVVLDARSRTLNT